jgi:hypothetical protein
MRALHSLNQRFQLLNRVFFISMVLAIIQLQIFARSPQSRVDSVTTSSPLFRNVTEGFYTPDLRLAMSLPLTPGFTPRNSTDAAVTFLRLPTWSHGYHDCASEGSEVSCHEVVTAAAALKLWEKSVSSGQTTGYVWVNVKDKPFPDRLSMLYHGLQIAASTNRGLHVDKKKFAPLQLPDSVHDTKDDLPGDEVKSDHTFVCMDISARHPKLTFQSASWPQALYIHATIAPYLKEHFGYHAAYFLGNYLFGSIDRPASQCRTKNSVHTVEDFQYLGDRDMLRPSKFNTLLGRCGVNASNSVLVFSGDESITGTYASVHKLESSAASQVCGLRILMSSKRIVSTFGSRLGFWATALQGNVGGFVNPLDKLCVNMTNSQQGSLWHTFCPREKSACVYRTNSRLYVCGSTVDDIKSYIQYLLW